MAAQAAPLQQSPVPGWKRTTASGAVWEYENPTDAGSSNQDASHLLKQPVQDSSRSPYLALKRLGIFSSRTHKSDSTYEIALPASPPGIHLQERGPSVESLAPEMTTRDPAGGAIAPSAWNDLSIDQENPWREEVSISNRGVYKAALPETSIDKRRDTCPASKEMTESREPKSKPMGRIAPYKPPKRLKFRAPPRAESGNPTESKSTQKRFSFLPGRRSAPPPQNHNQTATASSSASRTQTNQSDTLGSHQPYGGYCKGAYKLQVGLEKESVNRRNQSVSMTGQAIYWACASSKCAFEGPACKKGKKWIFDETVFRTDGVQYRWSFLAKCHVAASRVYDGKYDYQCVFCDVQPSSRSVHRGQNAFMEHVSQQHRGQRPDPTIWDKIHGRVACIYGRVADEEESFDVNLSPKEEGHPPGGSSAGTWYL